MAICKYSIHVYAMNVCIYIGDISASRKREISAAGASQGISLPRKMQFINESGFGRVGIVFSS